MAVQRIIINKLLSQMSIKLMHATYEINGINRDSVGILMSSINKNMIQVRSMLGGALSMIHT